MKAMLFAAGMGTRLKPLTDHMPKALVEVGGRPLLDIVVRRLVDAGATEVVVNVHHFADQIKSYVASHDWGIDVHLSDETEALLDTGGGLRKALPLFHEGGDAPVLLHNVDILSNADLRGFYERSRHADVTLMVSSRDTQRYLLFDDEGRLRGWTNIATGEVRSPYSNLDVANLHRYAFSGRKIQYQTPMHQNVYRAEIVYFDLLLRVRPRSSYHFDCISIQRLNKNLRSSQS